MALKGVKVIELAGLAPAPFCGLILSDFGASVIKVEKPKTNLQLDGMTRGKQSIVLDIKHPQGGEVFHRLCSTADVLIEPYRAGVMEKLGFGPKVMHQTHPRLVYARLSGFGHNGPFSKLAGHDINYISMSGVLSLLGHVKESPRPPLNLVADFAGGGLMCALGITMALFERSRTGMGQVVDANMVEGSSYLSTFVWRSKGPKYPLPLWSNPRGQNILDGGAPFYRTYKTKDGKYVAVGALEPQFYKLLLKGLELREEDHSQFSDWDETTKVFADRFATKTRDEWCKVFDGTDACVTPVLSLDEAPSHPHNSESHSFIQDEQGSIHPRPSPRLSNGDESNMASKLKEPLCGEHTQQVLKELGYADEDIQKMVDEGVIECNEIKSKL